MSPTLDTSREPPAQSRLRNARSRKKISQRLALEVPDLRQVGLQNRSAHVCLKNAGENGIIPIILTLMDGFTHSHSRLLEQCL